MENNEIVFRKGASKNEIHDHSNQNFESLEPKKPLNDLSSPSSVSSPLLSVNATVSNQIDTICKSFYSLKSIQFRICVLIGCNFSGWLYPTERCPLCCCVTVYMGCDSNIWKGPEMDVEMYNKIKLKWEQCYIKELLRCRENWKITDSGKQFVYKDSLLKKT